MLRSLVAACFVLCGAVASAEDSELFDREMDLLNGQTVDLSRFEGRVVMIVNVASRCGATPQYEPLQALYEKYKDQGFVVVGFPCNQFGRQEPGTAKQIQEFCSANYDVTFPLFAKIDVNGADAADIYKHLTSEEAYPADAGKVKWNFEKFLISRDGEVVERFRTRVQPDSEKVVKAIERELAKKASDSSAE
ncbi:glutathione peroxidase [Stratiformator vulcanicus]|uniref:Glutathione peroxidase n=1 Tax=Stratiformator vulcanicus TaxID=2527980 RepID=A0A517R439_9PLAN|nr:glutathione peroxidase [Stratiformator vulcanicus]QDT38610.1 Hydroperoxy fatty acid reductase gpx1 [Stratiformator vulcanicus]